MGQARLLTSRIRDAMRRERGTQRQKGDLVQHGEIALGAVENLPKTGTTGQTEDTEGGSEMFVTRSDSGRPLRPLRRMKTIVDAG
jgi:hypothetical protein